MPRAGDAVTAAGTGGCAVTCGVPEDQRLKFDAVSSEVDYARYCPTSCASLGAEKDAYGDEALLCAAPSALLAASAAAAARGPQAFQLLGVSSALGPAPAPAPAPAPVNIEEQVTGAVLQLAKSKMLDAKRNAEVAGASAKAAREAYETVTVSATAMGTAAGQATLRQVQRAAGEQAMDVWRARQQYVASSQKKASDAAQAAAMVYRDAKLRDLAGAGTWFGRSQQFKKAAQDREAIAEQVALQAQRYEDAGDHAAASAYTAKENEAMDQSERFAEEAAAAEKQADAIGEGAKWYDQAMVAAAASVLVSAVPPDVPPPLMPPLA